VGVSTLLLIRESIVAIVVQHWQQKP